MSLSAAHAGLLRTRHALSHAASVVWNAVRSRPLRNARTTVFNTILNDTFEDRDPINRSLVLASVTLFFLASLAGMIFLSVAMVSSLWFVLPLIPVSYLFFATSYLLFNALLAEYAHQHDDLAHLANKRHRLLFERRLRRSARKVRTPSGRHLVLDARLFGPRHSLLVLADFRSKLARVETLAGTFEHETKNSIILKARVLATEGTTAFIQGVDLHLWRYTTADGHRADFDTSLRDSFDTRVTRCTKIVQQTLRTDPLANQARDASVELIKERIGTLSDLEASLLNLTSARLATGANDPEARAEQDEQLRTIIANQSLDAQLLRLIRLTGSPRDLIDRINALAVAETSKLGSSTT